MGGVLRVLLTLAMAGASIAYFAGEKRVTLADEGNVRRVTTFAPTVGGALKRQGIRVRADDRVSPSLTSALAGHIELRRAKDIVLVLNGQHGPARVTARTVRSVLDELSVRHEGAVVKPALGTAVGPGDQILVSQPVQVTVVHDGVSEQVTTNAVTAGDLLREMDIQLGPQDRVEPSTGAHPDPSAPVRLVRVK